MLLPSLRDLDCAEAALAASTASWLDRNPPHPRSTDRETFAVLVAEGEEALAAGRGRRLMGVALLPVLFLLAVLSPMLAGSDDPPPKRRRTYAVTAQHVVPAQHADQLAAAR